MKRSVVECVQFLASQLSAHMKVISSDCSSCDILNSINHSIQSAEHLESFAEWTHVHQIIGEMQRHNQQLDVDDVHY